MTSITNFQELDNALADLGYAVSVQKNLRAAIRAATTAYNTDLHRIGVSLQDFDEKWGKGRVRVLPKTFKSASSFRQWRKLVRMSLTRLLGAPKTAPLSPEAVAILSFVRENQGNGSLLGLNSDITLSVVLSEVTKSGIKISAADQGWVDQTALGLENSRRKSFVRGISRLNRLIELAPSELAGLLPEAALPSCRNLRPKPSAWRRSAHNPASLMLWLDFDRIMQLKRYGEEGIPVVGTPSELKDASIAAYENSLSWLLRELSALDRLEDGCELREVVTCANLLTASNAWIVARQERGQKTDTSSLHAHVTRLVHIATGYLDVSPTEEMRLRKLRKSKIVRTMSVGKMSIARESWIREFDRDRAKQELVHRLPEVLMVRSRAILARANAGRKVAPTEIMLALRMGVAALQAGLLFRASPARATNLRTARMRGENAEFDTQAFKDAPKAVELRFTVPAAQVKNGNLIDEIADDDLGPIVLWYLEEIRPLLIASHPFGKNHADSDYLFPSRSNAPMERSVFAETFGRACREVGFEMTMHQARHVCAYCILKDDPNAWDEAAAVLGDDEMTVRKYYAWMSEKKASEAGRAKLRAARGVRQKSGTGAHADAA